MPRFVVVTGASSGIGRAVASRLLDEGHAVLGLARDFSKFQHPRLKAVEVDLAELATLPEQLKNLVDGHAGVDAVVLNAGRGEFGGLEEFSFAQIRSLVDLNFVSHAYVVRAFLPTMKKVDRGDLVFIGSEAALAGKRRGAVYCATKFALRGFSQALREECAASGIRVTLVNPGMVRTPFFDKLDFAPGNDPENYVLPEDVAEVVSMVLASRPQTTFDEINLSPLKRVVRHKKGERG